MFVTVSSSWTLLMWSLSTISSRKTKSHCGQDNSDLSSWSSSRELLRSDWPSIVSSVSSSHCFFAVRSVENASVPCPFLSVTFGGKFGCTLEVWPFKFLLSKSFSQYVHETVCLLPDTTLLLLVLVKLKIMEQSNAKLNSLPKWNIKNIQIKATKTCFLAT